MDIKKAREILKQNPEFKKEYEKFDLFWEIEKLWIKLKIRIKSFLNPK